MRKFVFLFFCLFALLANAEYKHYSFEGILGEDISFRLDLEEEEYEGFVIGKTTYYRKDGGISQIKIYGQSHDDDYAEGTFHILNLQEFLGTKVCGNWSLVLDDGDFVSGEWTLGEKNYMVTYVHRLNTDGAPTMFRTLPIFDAAGVYEFSYSSGNEGMPEYGGSMQLYLDHRNLAYNICQVTPNIAEVRGTTSEFAGNSFYLLVSGVWYRVVTFEGVAFVTHVSSDAAPCEDFGANADIVGAYVATDKALSDEITEAFAEEEAFGAKISCNVFDLNEAWAEAFLGETTFPDELLLKDIDGDGRQEIIARYIPGLTEGYEVEGARAAVFASDGDVLVPLFVAEGPLEDLEIADGWVICNVKNNRGTRTTHHFLKLLDGQVQQRATMTEANINSFTIDGSTVKEKQFKKMVKTKNRVKVTDLDGWLTIPGNQKRNENAARG